MLNLIEHDMSTDHKTKMLKNEDLVSSPVVFIMQISVVFFMLINVFFMLINVETIVGILTL